MPIRKLHKIFRPKCIAVIGASNEPGKVGYTVFRNLVQSGFQGPVFPINPARDRVQGVACFPSISAAPQPVDLAVICTPADTVPDLIATCGQAGVGGAIVTSAGFRETGDEGQRLEERLLAAARDAGGVRVLGPNCLGVLVPQIGLNASFAAAMPRAGRVAFLSQSGALCTAVLDWARQEEIGFSCFVSVGNMLDVGMADLIDYLAGDPQTDSIVLYVESIENAREFMSAARAFTRRKPIVAYKAGRFAASAKAAASHTGALAGVDAVYDAAFQRAGIVRVLDMDDMFNCAELLSRHRFPAGPRLAMITNAGGPGVMASDELIERRGVLAELAPATIEQLSAALPRYWSHANPIDILGDAPPERFAQALDAVVRDRGVDAALVILTPQAMTDPTAAATAVARAAGATRKPVLAAWMGGQAVRAGVQLLNDAGVPTYATPERAVRAFMHLVSYSRNREMLYTTPHDVPLRMKVDREAVRRQLETAFTAGRETLTEDASKALLEAYGIPTAMPRLALTQDDAAALARKIGFPVVLKILAPQITHKTDVDGVVLNLANETDVRAAFERIVQSARWKRPDAEVQGVTVQRMITAPVGHELILGAKRDPVFGAVILVGAGGTAAEVLRDMALGLPPLDEALARRMLESLRIWPLLSGFRGRPGIAVDKAVEVLLRFSYLVADLSEIREIDANPVLATPSDVIALDARVVLDADSMRTRPRPFSHLAIRPYPEEYVRRAVSRDGTPVTLRPIKPEDEPAWQAMLNACSPETIRFRFRHLFKEATHEMASRFCYIDYDRELAIVIERQRDDASGSELLGVGRLVADADHDTAEYAVLIADAWQKQGLGTLVTEYCLEIARRWGLRKIYAETAPNNAGMLATFRRLGFDLRHTSDWDVIVAEKRIADTDAASAQE